VRIAALVLLLLCACGKRGDDAGPAQAPNPPPAPNAPAAPSEAPDPWALPTPADPDDIAVPDRDEVRALADQACPVFAAPHFFRVEKGGKTSHLLGTRHVGVGAAKLPAVVKDAFAAARLVVFETAGDGPELAYDGPPLDQALGADLWRRYEGIVGARRAWLVREAPPAAALVGMSIFEDFSQTLDQELEEMARDRGVELRGLESHELQNAIMLELLDLRMLRAAIQTTEGRAELKKDTFEDLVQYCAGTDTEPGMDEEDRRDMRGAGYTDAELVAYEERIIYARNRDWIPKLEGIFAEGGAFVAVGEDHLIGDRGVVALLTARGYRLTRVTPP
jgi:uncharacterized protein YbaP (TraB family)